MKFETLNPTLNGIDGKGALIYLKLYPLHNELISHVMRHSLTKLQRFPAMNSVDMIHSPLEL